jgi:3-deoxy-D-manno-octulosonic-acid transferase
LHIILYNIFLFFYKIGIRIASLWDQKAKQWLRGRRGIFETLKKTIIPGEKIIWVHCSSLGEFEQASPLLDNLRIVYPAYKILLTFFSPSGFEARKNYRHVHYVFYLPLDSRKNANRLLGILNPSLVIFVKYEFWFYYLKSIKKRSIPLLLVSAIFRKDQPFFKWYGQLNRQMLLFFTHIFVQNEESKKLLETINIAQNVSVSGDTRFDRVVEIAEKFIPVDGIARFVGSNKTIVAGSSWPDDEKIISCYLKDNSSTESKWIIAPHEVNKKHLEDLRELFPGSIFYSQLNAMLDLINKNVLIIDNIGMLSRVYKYATIAYIGGGFGKEGVHNVLEAAVYGKPIVFGPVYHQFNEAQQLVLNQAAVSISSYEDFAIRIKQILNEYETRIEMSEKTQTYVYSNKGATEKIIRYIQENRLLTNW